MEIKSEIKNWNSKPKELITYLTQAILKDENLFPQTIQILKDGSDVEKGTIADVLKHVSEQKPEIVAPYTDQLVGYINYKAPRVKWGIPESIGNVAAKFPLEAKKAIPYLLKNTKDSSTVVRWCAAYALSEIAKSAPSDQDVLLKIQELADDEQNNGVKNVYQKALKSIAFRNKLK
jgi:HEAT repeat protein